MDMIIRFYKIWELGQGYRGQGYIKWDTTEENLYETKQRKIRPASKLGHIRREEIQNSGVQMRTTVLIYDLNTRIIAVLVTSLTVIVNNVSVMLIILVLAYYYIFTNHLLLLTLNNVLRQHKLSKQYVYSILTDYYTLSTLNLCVQ